MDYTNHPELGNYRNYSSLFPAISPTPFINAQIPPTGLVYLDPIEFMKTYVSCCKEMYQLGVNVGEYYASKATENQQNQQKTSGDNNNGIPKGV